MAQTSFNRPPGWKRAWVTHKLDAAHGDGPASCADDAGDYVVFIEHLDQPAANANLNASLADTCARLEREMPEEVFVWSRADRTFLLFGDVQEATETLRIAARLYD